MSGPGQATAGRPRALADLAGGDASIQESKAFVCNVRPGRRRQGTAVLAGIHDRPPGVAPNRDHPAEARGHSSRRRA